MPRDLAAWLYSSGQSNGARGMHWLSFPRGLTGEGLKAHVHELSRCGWGDLSLATRCLQGQHARRCCHRFSARRSGPGRRGTHHLAGGDAVQQQRPDPRAAAEPAGQLEVVNCPPAPGARRRLLRLPLRLALQQLRQLARDHLRRSGVPSSPVGHAGRHHSCASPVPH